MKKVFFIRFPFSGLLLFFAVIALLTEPLRIRIALVLSFSGTEEEASAQINRAGDLQLDSTRYGHPVEDTTLYHKNNIRLLSANSLDNSDII
jgi:hypothetical protein